MTYAIYFTWKDGFADIIVADSARERDLNIREMLKRNDFCEISYCPIYASGEYGTEKYVKECYENIRRHYWNVE